MSILFLSLCRVVADEYFMSASVLKAFSDIILRFLMIRYEMVYKQLNKPFKMQPFKMWFSTLNLYTIQEKYIHIL